MKKWSFLTWNDLGSHPLNVLMEIKSGKIKMAVDLAQVSIMNVKILTGSRHSPLCGYSPWLFLAPQVAQRWHPGLSSMLLHVCFLISQCWSERLGMKQAETNPAPSEPQFCVQGEMFRDVRKNALFYVKVLIYYQHSLVEPGLFPKLRLRRKKEVYPMIWKWLFFLYWLHHRQTLVAEEGFAQLFPNYVYTKCL